MRFPRRVMRAIGLLCLILLTTSGILLSPGTADAADDQLVAIRFSEVTVPISGDGKVVLAGTITNTSGGPLHNVQAMVWRDGTALTTPEQVTAAVESAPTQPLGRRVCCEIGTFQDLTTPGNPLPDGVETEFHIELEVADLEFPDTPGAYLIGLHVRGSTDGSAPWTVGRARTFALRTTPDAPRPEVTSVVVLSSRPSMVRNDVLADDHLAAELAPGGRLSVLLESAGRPNVSHAVDPSLLDEVIMMSDGYQVLDEKGQLQEGSGAAAADQWLVAFEKLTGDRFRLPYALPDLTALVTLPEGAGRDLANHAHEAGDAVSEVADDPLLMLTSAQQWNDEAVLLADSYQPAALVVANVDSLDVLLQPKTATPMVRTDPTVFAGGPGPQGAADPIRLRQRLSAAAFVDALAERDTPLRIIDTTEKAELDAAAPANTQRRSLTSLLADEPISWAGGLNWTDTMSRTRLQPAQLAAVQDLALVQSLFDDLLVDPSAQRLESHKIIGRGVSTWWRDHAVEQAAFLRPATEELHDLTAGDAVFLRAPKRVTLSMREGTTFPATITNRLDRAVKVRPIFETVQGQRIRFPEQPLVVVEGGQSVTVNVEPVAEVNGTVEITGNLTTAGGHQVGEPVEIVVDVTDLGLAVWVIVAVSGIVLIGTTTLRIRQVRARQVQEAQRDPE